MQISDSIADGLLILSLKNTKVYLLNILCQQQCKLDVSKSAVTAIEFNSELEHFLRSS